MKKVKRGIVAIIENEKGEFLLMLRDQTPGIPFPNQWYFPSGASKKGESFKETVKRELREELGLNAINLVVFKKYHGSDPCSGALEFDVFYLKTQKPIKDMELNEGAAIEFKKEEEILKLDLAFNHSEIFRDFLKQRRKL